MSNLKLNIPITFDNSAILDISNSYINRLVQGTSGSISNLSQTYNNIDLSIRNDLEETGINLNTHEITLNAPNVYINGVNFIGDDNGRAYINADFIDVKLAEAEYLTSTASNVIITINEGIIKAQSTEKNSYIKIGVDSTGYMTLQYYNESYNGREIFYELSPYTPFSSYLNI